jgi:hypothetical protein
MIRFLLTGTAALRATANFNYKLWLWCLQSVIAISVLFGCAYGDPHAIFLEGQRGWIGSSVDNFNAIQDDQNLRQRISDLDMGKGRRIAKYWYANGKVRKCIQVVEYDAVSRRILSMGFEGKPEHCIRNPV